MSELAKTLKTSISSTARTEKTTTLSILIRTIRMTYLVTRISLTILTLTRAITITTHQDYQQLLIQNNIGNNTSADPFRVIVTMQVMCVDQAQVFSCHSLD